jgi:peptidoglycan/xylan/chitin deacetylase (PgdA/CDA1 family)
MIDRPPIWLQGLFGRLRIKMPSGKKELYLTFDDGPTMEHSRWILDQLNSFNAKATFFCIGNNIEKHPEVFQDILNSGHRVGNHSYDHIHNWKTSQKVIREDFKRCQELHGFDLYRPPYGEFSPKLLRAVPKLPIVLWDVLTEDYNPKRSPEFCLEKSLRKTRDGSIVVLHDSDKAWERMSYVLPRYLKHFSEKGYTFKALPSTA